VPTRVGIVPAPRAAHGTEAEVVCYVVGEDALRDQPRWPVGEVRPVPLLDGCERI
jgi:hypothetical protein